MPSIIEPTFLIIWFCKLPDFVVDFFHIDSTVIDNISFSHRTIDDTGGGSFDIERVSFVVDKLKIDSSHFDFHEKRIAKDIVVKLHDREAISADSMYHFKANNVTYYYSLDKIVVDSFEVKPRFERQEFFKRAGLQTDLMQVKLQMKNGDIINKIGSAMIAQLAHDSKIPVYIIADSWKFSSKDVKIEERSYKEVWKNAPKNIKIKNLAFEKVPSKYIKAIISDLGILSPKKFVRKIK